MASKGACNSISLNSKYCTYRMSYLCKPPKFSHDIEIDPNNDSL